MGERERVRRERVRRERVRRGEGEEGEGEEGTIVFWLDGFAAVSSEWRVIIFNGEPSLWQYD